LSNNRANRSVQDLQAQSQREKLGTHAPHISRGAISKHNTKHTAQKHTTSASRSQYKETKIHHAQTHAQRQRTHKQRPRQSSQAKRGGRKSVGARCQKPAAQNLKKAGGKKYQNSTPKRRQYARETYFLLNAYKKIQNTFYYYADLAEIRRF
jgi:hypothetical protein